MDYYGLPLTEKRIQILFGHLVNPPMVVQQGEEEMGYHKECNAAQAIVVAGGQKTETEYQRKYLIEGLRDARDEKIDSLSKAFGLTDDDAPRTFKDFIARVKAGDIMYDGAKDEDYEHGSIYHHLRWRSPKRKEDKTGYRAAKARALAAYARAKDDIVVLPLETGLESKRAYEAADFTS
jgi:hypothetical protein